ncbi:uncharacterized protein LOC133931128 [Phragmites australis]|uniref:uncharacterized protein LOC133931128 n=1 Tax=Phragmites australis TaxID=29695 RepID=UPI002D79CAAE|nr:uncharacterized protein LOC133931128 [Phragmites australis]
MMQRSFILCCLKTRVTIQEMARARLRCLLNATTTSLSINRLRKFLVSCASVLSVGLSNQPTMAAPVRAWLVVMALACALLLLLRSSDAAPDAGEAVSSGAAKPKCVAGAKNDKACRVGIGHDPENQEEEGSFSVGDVKAPSGAPDAESDDDYNDPDVPNDGLIVAGH